MTERLQNKYENFCNALKRLNEMNAAYKKNKTGEYSEMARDALIQRFEFTFELAWKSLKEFLIFSGYIEATTPRSVLETAYREGFINNDNVWIAMMNDRNLTTHVYKESEIIEIADRISLKYCKELSELKELFK